MTNQQHNILCINPGSTSTKIAVYNNNDLVFEDTIRHPAEELNQYKTITDQYDFRKTVLINVLKEKNFSLADLSCVVGRGGLLRPIKGGTYAICSAMLHDLKNASYGEHASNLGAVLAYEIAANMNIPAFIVDPVVVDEMDDLARYTGIPELQRKSIFHALNQKAVARTVAKEMNKNYADLNLIIAHLGGGITVGAHKNGAVIDVNNGLDGEGAFSPERSGSLPVGDLAKICFSGQYTLDEVKKKIKGNGGLMAYLGTNSGKEVNAMIEQGNQEAKKVYQAMAYQAAKEIGSLATVLHGNVDAIILTGGLAYDNLLISWITDRVYFIAQVLVYPGEDEMPALAAGALRVLTRQEQALKYSEQGNL